MKLLVITSLYSVYYMYMYCSYFIIQERSFLHKALLEKRDRILDLLLKHGGDSNIEDDVSNYILFIIRM